MISFVLMDHCVICIPNRVTIEWKSWIRTQNKMELPLGIYLRNLESKWILISMYIVLVFSVYHRRICVRNLSVSFLFDGGTFV